MTTIRYPIRDVAGRVVAVHVRGDRNGEKVCWWQSPDESKALPAGVGVRDLPLYGSERVPAWAPADAIIVTEGEKDADALVRCGIPAVGTVTGAGTVPYTAALAPVAAGRRFVLWPDSDAPGWGHMVALAVVLRRAGARAVRIIDVRTQDWPSGAGADDVVGGLDAPVAQAVVAVLVDEWSVRPPEPSRAPVRPYRRVQDDGSVSDALRDRYGVDRAAPGRNARCPKHDDRHASLSILRDDRRAICHSPTCAWSTPGVTASMIRDAA